jgi:AAA domain
VAKGGAQSEVEANGSNQRLRSKDVLARNGIVPISAVPRERIDWVWMGRAAFGKHTDVSGDPSDGKSLMVTALAAQVTRGRALPYGNEQVREPQAVLFLSSEDDAGDTIRPRFEAAEGDPQLLHVQKDAPLMLPRDAEELRWIIEELRAGMVVIDPLFS